LLDNWKAIKDYPELKELLEPPKAKAGCAWELQTRSRHQFLSVLLLDLCLLLYRNPPYLVLPLSEA
jgi:hypothetical protein